MSTEIVGTNVVAKVERVEEYGLYLNFAAGKILVLIPDAVVSPGTRLTTAFNPGDTLIVKVIKYIPEKSIFKGTLNIMTSSEATRS